MSGRTTCFTRHLLLLAHPAQSVRRLPGLDAAGGFARKHRRGRRAQVAFAGQHRVDHDVSLLIPELWCRLRASERSAVSVNELMATWREKNRSITAPNRNGLPP